MNNPLLNSLLPKKNHLFMTSIVLILGCEPKNWGSDALFAYFMVTSLAILIMMTIIIFMTTISTMTTVIAVIVIIIITGSSLWLHDWPPSSCDRHPCLHHLHP